MPCYGAPVHVHHMVLQTCSTIVLASLVVHSAQHVDQTLLDTKNVC